MWQRRSADKDGINARRRVPNPNNGYIAQVGGPEMFQLPFGLGLASYK